MARLGANLPSGCSWFRLSHLSVLGSACPRLLCNLLSSSDILAFTALAMLMFTMLLKMGQSLLVFTSSSSTGSSLVGNVLLQWLCV